MLHSGREMFLPLLLEPRVLVPDDGVEEGGQRRWLELCDVRSLLGETFPEGEDESSDPVELREDMLASATEPLPLLQFGLQLREEIGGARIGHGGASRRPTTEPGRCH